MVGTQTRLNPFPGLRPFAADEDYLFFGREGQTDELLRRLRRTRFLAVVGTSGSGKSSLLRAGLLPALHSGFMTKAGSSWRVAVLRPGDDPIANLARALNHSDVFGSDAEDIYIQTIVTETVLRRGALGLVEVVQQARMPNDENLLIVVDQFEEIFRFKQKSSREGSGDEAVAFVKLLLEATQQQELPIYVVLTMRSDYLGNCAQFRDLPEAMNDSQYLIPRMTRDQLRMAIEGPVAVGRAEIAPRLVNRLLNDVGDNQDQLPILQHALMRTWNYWIVNHEAGEPIDLRHYEAIGGMDKALSQHADEIYWQLPDDRSRKIAEKLFKCLTEKGPDGRGIRHPTRLSEVCAVATAEEAEVIDIVERFRASDRSFLMPPMGVNLHGDSVLDISHESLMRIWERLHEWVDKEAESAQLYRRLADSAIRHQEGKAALWRDPELTIALNWRAENKPNQAWAYRYNPAFEQAIQFLEASSATRDAEVMEREEEERRQREQETAQKIAEVREREEKKRQQQELEAVRKIAQEAKARSNAEEEARKQAEQRAKQEEKARQAAQRTIRVTAGASAIVLVFAFSAALQWRKSQLNTINALAATSEASLLSNKQLEALVAAVQSVKQSQNPILFQDPAARQTAYAALQRAVYNVQERNRLEGHSGAVISVAFSPNGKTLASGSWDNRIKLWDVATGKELYTLNGHSSAVYSVAFSPNGKTLASGNDDSSVKLWDVATGKELYTLNGHSGAVGSVAFSPDGKTLASGSADYTVKLWDVATGKELHTLVGHSGAVYSVAFSPDGKTLASGNDDSSVKLWDVATGKELHTLVGHSSAVYSVAFSPTGKTLASGSADSSVKLWDVAIGKELHTLNGHSGAVNSVAFSPTGKTLASGNDDSSVKLWKLYSASNLNDLITLSCNWLYGYLKTNPNVSDRTLCDGIGTQK